MDFTGEDFSTPPVEQVEETPVAVEDGQLDEAKPDAQQEMAERVKGLETAIGREREERRILQEKAKYLEQMAFQNAVKDSTPEYDPDDFTTFGAVDNLVEKRLAGKIGAIEERFKQSEIERQEAEAMAKYPDFQNVVSVFTKELIEEDPDMYGVIMASKNPAVAAYKYGRTHPKYVEKLQQSTAQTIAKKIEGNVNNTPTLSAIGGVSNDRPQAGYYNRLPSSDFNRLVQEILSKP